MQETFKQALETAIDASHSNRKDSALYEPPRYVRFLYPIIISQAYNRNLTD